MKIKETTDSESARVVTPWQFPNGLSKPEFKLVPKKPLSDGTKVIVLSEPSIKDIRKASKALEFDTSLSTTGDRTPTQDSTFSYGVTLIASVSGLSEDVIEELSLSDFTLANEYLASFA